MRGLRRSGDKLDLNMADFTKDVVGACAAIGDQYWESEAGWTSGEQIRWPNLG